MNDAPIYKSNALIEASYKLSINEQRIILACIAQVRRDQPITDEVMYRVTVNDIAELSGSESKALYTDLAEAAAKLRKREVRLILEPNSNRRKPKVMVAGWVQTIVYVEAEGHIDLRFNKDMLPYLTELKEQFTRYSLSDVAKMTSTYGIRLFELLIQYASVGRREISVEDLREWFQLEEGYPLMSDLRRWVIEPAVNQINDHGPLVVKWEPRKAGRKITHLLFTFDPKKSQAEEIKKAAKPGIRYLSKYELGQLARPGESYPDALKRLGAKMAP